MYFVMLRLFLFLLCCIASSNLQARIDFTAALRKNKNIVKTEAEQLSNLIALEEQAEEEYLSCEPDEYNHDDFTLKPLLKHIVQQQNVFLKTHDIDLIFGGRTRQESFLFKRPVTFRGDYNDTYSFIRSKFNFDVTAHYGRRTYGKQAATLHTRITAFNFWNDFELYTPLLEEHVYFNGDNFIKKSSLGDHKHNNAQTLFYAEQAYLDLLADVIHPSFKNYNARFRMGFFPYKLGRGVALGDYFTGAIQYLGYKDLGNPGNGTLTSPGILLSLDFTDTTSLELYYTKWKKRSHGSDFTRDEVRAKRTDISERENTQKLQRGSYADRDLFAAKLKKTFNLGKHSTLYLEPYSLYLRAPELEIEREADSRAQLTTTGLMAQYTHNGFQVNFECALQFGSQRVHPIDRNHMVMDDAYYHETHGSFDPVGETAEQGKISFEAGGAGLLNNTVGKPTKYHSHVLLGYNKNLLINAEDPDEKQAWLKASEPLPYRAYYASDNIEHVNKKLGSQYNGKYIERYKEDDNGVRVPTDEPFVMSKFSSDFTPFDSLHGSYTYKAGIDHIDEFNRASQYTLGPNGSLIHADIPFGGGARFRDGYTVNYAGFMGLLDIGYVTEHKDIMGGICCGYISGDDYPFNTEKDKTYRGFIPLKDANYTGHFVNSYAMFAARKLPRPTNFVDTLLYAPNNYEDLGNLAFIGIGGRYMPLEDREDLICETNALYFWESSPPFAWDKNAVRTFGNELHDGMYSYLQNKKLHFAGAPSKKRASAALGAEFNVSLMYLPVKNCELRFLGGVFLPGKLYKDIDGMPNRYTIRVDKDGDLHFDSLGTLFAYGYMFRVTYWF